MDRNRIRMIAAAGIFMALVIVMTIYPKVPIPATQGYINLGDSMILLSTLFFGGWFGALVGSFGSAVADLISGYAKFAPFTFVIKGIEALIFALLLNFFKKHFNPFTLSISAILATSWMIAGYFIAEVFMMGSKAAFAEVPGNGLQAAGSVIICVVLYTLTYKKIPAIYKKTE